MSKFLHLRVSVYVSTYLRIRVFVYVSTYLRLRICVYESLSTCLRSSVCVYVSCRQSNISSLTETIRISPSLSIVYQPTSSRSLEKLHHRKKCTIVQKRLNIFAMTRFVSILTRTQVNCLTIITSGRLKGFAPIKKLAKCATAPVIDEHSLKLMVRK